MCRKELEAEVRLQVDDLMREELKNLKLVRPLVCVVDVAVLAVVLYALMDWWCPLCSDLEGLAGWVNVVCLVNGVPPTLRLLTETRVVKERRKRRGRCLVLLSGDVSE